MYRDPPFLQDGRGATIHIHCDFASLSVGLCHCCRWVDALTPGAKTCLMGQNREPVTVRIAFGPGHSSLFLPAWGWRCNWVKVYDIL